MDTLSYIIGRNSAGGGSGSSSWSDISGKPFNTIGAGLEVSSGALKEAVPLYTESSGQIYGPGMKIIGFSGNSITIAGNDEVAIFAADTDYTVTAKSEGAIYTGSWNSTTKTWLDTPDGFTLSIVEGGKSGYDYTFTVGALNSVDWVLVEPIDPNEANLTEANVQLIGSGNIIWTTVDESTTVVHQLPAQYVPIDNSTLVNDNGVLKAVAATPSVAWSDISGKPTFATVATSGDYDDLLNKPAIPSTTGLATETYVDNAIANIDIPQADGTTIIDNNGVWSAVGGGGGSVVSITNTLSTGTAIGDIAIDGVTTTLYAPAGNWLAGSIQPGYIDNKPPIKQGNGIYSILEGYHISTGNDGDYSHAEGHDTAADGSSSHAEGFETWARGTASHAEGVVTIAGSNYQHVQGKGNIQDTNNKYADIIGNGDANIRSNAEATDWQGNKFLAGDVYAGVVNWATPTLGSAKIPREADFNYALNMGLVDGLSQVQDAQDTIDNQSYDEWGQPEYAGGIEKSFTFRYVENFAIDGDEANRYSGYIWSCEFASAIPNPDYGNDPEGGGDEPEPEPEEEPEG